MFLKKANKPNLFFLAFLLPLLISSCSNTKNIAYFQHLQAQGDTITKISTTNTLFDATIKPKDLLSITVVTSEPETSRIYNLVVPQISDPRSQNNLYSQASLQAYLVEIDGTINFPTLGKINVVGMTRKQLEAFLLNKLTAAFNTEKPIITIRILNYEVNVLGEVLKPGKYTTTNERLTIFDGLALAGDMTIYGKRNNVKILRENEDGTKTYFTVNLNDADIIYSPAYYLQQNDVVYVEPNNAKTRSAGFSAAESFGISAVSLLVSLGSLIVLIAK